MFILAFLLSYALKNSMRGTIRTAKTEGEKYEA